MEENYFSTISKKNHNKTLQSHRHTESESEKKNRNRSLRRDEVRKKNVLLNESLMGHDFALNILF